MYKTGFGITLRVVYIYFSELASTLTHLGVSMLRNGFYSLLSDLTITGGICPSRFFIRRLYYNFIYRLHNVHALKYNILKVKYLHIRLIAPDIGHTIKKNFIKIRHTNIVRHLPPPQGTKPSTHLDQSNDPFSALLLIRAASSFRGASRAFSLIANS